MKKETIWRCDLSLQHAEYEEEALEAMSRVLKSGIYTLGPEVAKFEKEFASYIGVNHCIGVANGTDALSLSLRVLGIGRGDEVITTPFTAIPTVSAIVDTGATPVFVDIDPDTYLLDIGKVSSAITDRTKAVMPVHIFGNGFNVEQLRNILPEGISIVEDAAQAHGTSVDGTMAGASGDLAAFSFYPTKNLGAYGDGGAIMTSSECLADRLRKLRMYGMVDKDRIHSNGVNSRLDELQASVLRVKLRHLEEMNENRREVAARYLEGLPRDRFTYQKIADGVVGNWHVFTAEVEGNRDELSSYLAERDIQTNIYYAMPLHLQKALSGLGYRKGDFPVAEELCGRIIALPLYPELPIEQQRIVIDAINEFSQRDDLGAAPELKKSA